MRRMIVGSVICVSPALHADIMYTVDPVTLSNGYNVSGFIETNGNLGELVPADIIDYQIDVSGPVPYSFLPSNPGANVVIAPNSLGQGLLASTTDLSVSAPPAFSKNTRDP